MAMIGRIWLTTAMIADVAQETGKHRTTVARWLARREIPPAEHRLLDLTHNGNLGEIHEAWRGWSIDVRRGELVTPVGTCVTPGQIQSIPYRLALLSSVQREVRELREQLAASDPVSDRPNIALVPR